MICWLVTFASDDHLVRCGSKLRATPQASTLPDITKILVIEDDRATQDLFRQVLGEEGYEILLADSLDDATAGAAPDLVITDLVGIDRYDSGAARASVGRVGERYPATPIIVCTAYEQARREFDRLGAQAMLPKPFTIEALIETVARLAPR